MKMLVVENTWSAPIIERGWENGYVLIPIGHSLHGIHYNDMYQIDVHGGLTYSELVTEKKLKIWPELSKKDIGCWMVGFDTMHLEDDYKINKTYVIKETKNLKKQIENLK